MSAPSCSTWTARCSTPSGSTSTVWSRRSMHFGYTDDVVTLCHAMVGLPGVECEAMLHARYGKNFPLADINRAFIARPRRNSRGGFAAEERCGRIAGCAAENRIPDGDRDLFVAAHRGSAPDAGRNPPPVRNDPDLRRRRARQAEPRSLSSGGGALRPEAGGLRRGRGFQSRRDRRPRRRRDHHHGA